MSDEGVPAKAVSARKYSISEIDSMRAAVKQMFPLRSNPKSAEIEDRLRTHMLNGTDPEELSVASEEYLAAEIKHLRERQEAERRMREKLGKAR